MAYFAKNRGRNFNKMNEIIPNCDLVQISNGGHWCLDENPKEVILHLDNFINSLS